jgi:hypothetical protein
MQKKQNQCRNNEEGSGSDDLGNDDNEGSDSDDSDSKGSDDDDSKDKAMHIPFRTTLSGIMWYKCLICLSEEYDSETKVVFTP